MHGFPAKPEVHDQDSLMQSLVNKPKKKYKRINIRGYIDFLSFFNFNFVTFGIE
jgi:hypothetical protein